MNQIQSPQGEQKSKKSTSGQRNTNINDLIPVLAQMMTLLQRKRQKPLKRENTLHQCLIQVRHHLPKKIPTVTNKPSDYLVIYDG